MSRPASSHSSRTGMHTTRVACQLRMSSTDGGSYAADAQVVLYAEGQEPVQLSADEEQAEQLMRQAAVSWNLHNNRAMAVKLQKKALEVVQQGQARQEIVAEVGAGGWLSRKAGMGCKAECCCFTSRLES